MPSYRSFSGADIVATFGGQVIGELLSITWSVTREKAPTYVMGQKNPLGFARGKRGIAGSLVFAVFDRNALLEEMKKAVDSEGNSVARYQTYGVYSPYEGFLNMSNDPNAANNMGHWNELMQAAYNMGNQDLLEDAVEMVEVKYADQLLPFNITINFANDYGEKAKLSLIDVEIMNQGMGVSIDDLSTSQNYTFVARDIQELKAV